MIWHCGLLPAVPGSSSYARTHAHMCTVLSHMTNSSQNTGKTRTQSRAATAGEGGGSEGVGRASSWVFVGGLESRVVPNRPACPPAGCVNV